VAQFVAFSPAVEVNGQTVLAVVAGMGAFKDIAHEILTDKGIVDPQPGEWYSQQSWLDAYKDVAEKLGAKTLTQIGKSIPENADFPPDIDTIEKALASIDVAYHMNHRGGEIGHYNYTQVDEKSGKIVCDNPYPCDFDFGIITAMARRFSPQGVFADVSHDDTQPCRKKGAETCTYMISWR